LFRYFDLEKAVSREGAKNAKEKQRLCTHQVLNLKFGIMAQPPQAQNSGQ